MKQTGVLIFALLVMGLAATILVGIYVFQPNGAGDGDKDKQTAKSEDPENSEKKENDAKQKRKNQEPRVFPRGQKLLFWWDEFPEYIKRATVETGPVSNIHPSDYAGADSCKKCHQQNYDDWSKHPHRWMNAQAGPETIKGSFTDQDELKYLGGRATFTVGKNDIHKMTLTRDGKTSIYEIDQTLGSRFFQYYIGRLVEGPFPEGHPYRTTRHVLPFGYWFKKKSWVPVVHVGPELPDGQRLDPFNMPEVPEMGKSFLPYAKYCNMCHSTFAMGDNLFRKPFVLERHYPGKMHMDMAGYIENVHQELWNEGMTRENATKDQIYSIPSEMTLYDAETHGISFGIGCEACHFGCQEHVEQPEKLPSFAPRSEYLRLETEHQELQTGRTHDNLNWACGRCHTGTRPLYAGGMSTWNSTEYTDAMKGGCYTKLNCIQCHQPHQATGQTWNKTPAQDDAICISCHQQYSSKEQISAHTHHAPESTGSNCMNCHMPKINEGLQEVVRTHTIFSPTDKQMLEKNNPNACNICHTDKPIDWTTKYLKEWYSKDYNTEKITANYSEDPVGLGWLKSENEAVRLIAIDAMGRNKDRWAGRQLVESLNDPYLINRQFAMDVIEQVFDVKLEDFGYQFYMTPEERKAPIEKLLEHLNLNSK